MSLRRVFSVGFASVAVLLARASSAHADDEGSSSPSHPFVDVPLTLKVLHFSGDAGIGFGTYQDTVGGGGGTGAASTPVGAGSTHVGWGSSFDAAIGLPFLGELGAHIAQRFGADGVAVGSGPETGRPPFGADHFARLFDPVVQEPGLQDFANPEFHLRGTLVPLDVFELGLETRLTVPTGGTGSFLAFTPGIPMRIHVPGFMRIDTGLWLPVWFPPSPPAPNSEVFILDIPAQAFFQVGDAFFGPLTGARIVDIGRSGSSVDIPLGVGGGYTFGGIFDVKAQFRTERVNSGSWASQALGGGLGVGIRVP
jgi:hypothetical protein